MQTEGQRHRGHEPALRQGQPHGGVSMEEQGQRRRAGSALSCYTSSLLLPCPAIPAPSQTFPAILTLPRHPVIVPTRPDPAQPSQPCPAHLYLGHRPHSQLGWLLPDPWQWEFSPWAFQNLNKVLEKFSLISFVSVLLWVIIRSGNRATFCVSHLCCGLLPASGNCEHGKDWLSYTLFSPVSCTEQFAA